MLIQLMSLYMRIYRLCITEHVFGSIVKLIRNEERKKETKRKVFTSIHCAPFTEWMNSSNTRMLCSSHNVLVDDVGCHRWETELRKGKGFLLMYLCMCSLSRVSLSLCAWVCVCVSMMLSATQTLCGCVKNKLYLKINNTASHTGRFFSLSWNCIHGKCVVLMIVRQTEFSVS